MSKFLIMQTELAVQVLNIVLLFKQWMEKVYTHTKKNLQSDSSSLFIINNSSKPFPSNEVQDSEFIS